MKVISVADWCMQIWDSGLSASKSTFCPLFHNATHFIMERKREGLEERKKYCRLQNDKLGISELE